jgi:hypothetical protein
MKTNEEIKKRLNISNRTYCPKCGAIYFSVFDRLYIEKFGKCFECDEAGLSSDEKEVRITIVTNMLEKL